MISSDSYGRVNVLKIQAMTGLACYLYGISFIEYMLLRPLTGCGSFIPYHGGNRTNDLHFDGLSSGV